MCLKKNCYLKVVQNLDTGNTVPIKKDRPHSIFKLCLRKWEGRKRLSLREQMVQIMYHPCGKWGKRLSSVHPKTKQRRVIEAESQPKTNLLQSKGMMALLKSKVRCPPWFTNLFTNYYIIVQKRSKIEKYQVKWCRKNIENPEELPIATL